MRVLTSTHAQQSKKKAWNAILAQCMCSLDLLFLNWSELCLSVAVGR